MSYEISAYLQDKIEFGDMIINVGLRYDYFEPDGYPPQLQYSRGPKRKPNLHQFSLVGIARDFRSRRNTFSYGHFFFRYRIIVSLC